MFKKLIPLFIALLAPSVVLGADTLYEHFLETQGRFPTKQERAIEYNQVFPGEFYQGTATQNIQWLDYLNSNSLIFGATTQTPNAGAFIEDSLQAPISDSATSFTLVKGKDGHGTSLASSTYGFVFEEESSSSRELVIADCTGTSCTNATRGLSFNTGTSTVSGAAKAHRRGASVKITDAPFLLFAKNVFLGTQNIEFLMKYNGTKCDANSPVTAICDRSYITNVALQGAATSSELLGGIVRLATQLQMASSTFISANDPLVLQGRFATSTCQTSGLYVPVTSNNGKLTIDCLNRSEGWMVASTTSHLLAATNLTATGTTKFGGVTYTWPTSDASTTVTQVISSNGSGVLSSVNIGTSTRGIIPPFAGGAQAITLGSYASSNNTVMNCGKVIMPFGMSVNSISAHMAAVSGSVTFDFGVYSESGKDKLIDVTSSATSSLGVIKTTVSPPVSLLAGDYWVCVVPNGASNITFSTWDGRTYAFRKLSSDVPGEPRFSGEITGLSAGVLPASFSPTSLIAGADDGAEGVVVRFD